MKLKRFVSVIALFMAVILTVPSTFVLQVSAEEPQTAMEARSILKNLSSADYNKDEGYFYSIDDVSLLSGSYIRLTYSITGTYTDETAPFVFKPYDNTWGGWNDNFVTVGQSVKQSEGEYIAYASIPDIKASLTGGTLAGINAYFNQDAAYSTIVKDFSIMYPKTEEAPVTDADYSVTDQEVKVSNVGNVATLIVAMLQH